MTDDDGTPADTRIRKLDPATVDRIAAGEVVERPASAVKELVENSLDADADRIDVTVADGGKTGVRVADDGVGMSEADVRAAVRKHTTSKIRDIDDLEGGVATLGFRGEALATIGAVARLTVTTKPRAGDHDAGTELRLEGGEVTHVGPAGRPPGTTVAVEDLFYNTPARKKYLKTDSTEFAHVNRVVTRYALANPDVAVSLTHNDSEVFATTGQGDLQAALLSVYGREVATSMVSVDDAPDDAPVDGVRGYVSDPETTRSTREYVSTFVNGRYVRSSAIREAVLAAYGNQLAPDRFPFAVLFVDVPGDAVDVNVHPRKMEVRFGEETAVRDAVRSAVEDALLREGLVRTSAPRGRSAPGDATIEPSRHEHRPIEDPDRTGVGDGATAERRDGTEADSVAGRREQTGTTPTRTDATVGDHEAADAGTHAHDADGTGAAGASEKDDRTVPEEAVSIRDRSSRERDRVARREREADDGESRRTPDADRKFSQAGDNARLTDDAPAVEFDRLPPLRVLGQLDDTYVVAEAPDGLVLVDQHAADERINYERLAAMAAGGTGTQSLVSPVEVGLTAQEAALFDDFLADLRDLGFEAHLGDDGRTAVVEAVPAVFADALDPALVSDLLTEFVRDDRDHGDAVDSAADALLADLACYPAIKGNTSLREGTVVDLLERLDACENPWACPHGRPVVVQVSEQEIADRFERDYPGHQVRRPEE